MVSKIVSGQKKFHLPANFFCKVSQCVKKSVRRSDAESRTEGRELRIASKELLITGFKFRMPGTTIHASS